MSSEQPELQQKVSDVLSTITESAESTSASLGKLKEIISEDNLHPQLIKQLLEELDIPLPEGVSLLSLKNSSMLSYLNNLILVILTTLERIEGDNEEVINAKRSDLVKSSIVQRVTMERGVKGLENRLTYQLDKMTRAYDRMIEEEKTVEKKATSVKESEDSEEEDSEDEEDVSSYRPDASSLALSLQKEMKTKKKTEATSNEKYKPPRITPMLPPSVHDPEKSTKSSKTRKLQSMEEFLREQSDAPMAEESIGSTILQHGRGGIKTTYDKQKESEIQKYEESNFVRLSDSMLQDKKQSLKRKRQQDLNVFGGEDFSMFNNSKRDINDSSSRKRKPMSAWDRAKRKR